MDGHNHQRVAPIKFVPIDHRVTTGCATCRAGRGCGTFDAGAEEQVPEGSVDGVRSQR